MGKITLHGVVIKKSFGAGSKSQHDAIYIKTEKMDLVLRKKGTNPFENNELARLVGLKVEATGTISDYFFLVDEIKVVE